MSENTWPADEALKRAWAAYWESKDWKTTYRSIPACIFKRDMCAALLAAQSPPPQPQESAEIEAAKLRAILGRLVKTAHLLLESSMGCAVNHYAEDFDLHGTPGWLSDAEVDIIRARAALAAYEVRKG